MFQQKRACLIYVDATADRRAHVRARLEQADYVVCEVRASLKDAKAAKAGAVCLPPEVQQCISDAEFCLILLPEDETDDGLIAGAAGFASQLGKPFITVVAGTREKFPDTIGDCSRAILRESSSRLANALASERVWERADQSRFRGRRIKNVTCS